MKIAILQPYRPETPRAQLNTAASLLVMLIAAHPEHTFIVTRRPGVPRAGAGAAPYAPHADVRNQLVETLSADVDRVLWVDVDLVDYPAATLRRLLAVAPDGIAAPAIVYGDTGRFYDIGGFIERGRPFRARAPWCDQPGPIVELDSVGCLYLAPAWIYRAPMSARYAPTGPVYGVEHWSVCHAAIRAGCVVRADLSLIATHAQDGA